MSRHAVGAAAAMSVLAAAVVAWRFGQRTQQRAPEGSDSPPATRAAFVGREACARCHPQQAARWRGSHHDRAMERPSAESVAGDFHARRPRTAT